MYQLSVILAILFVFFIYYFGKVLFSSLFGVHEKHIFIGFGKKPIFTFTIRQLKISVGIFIPFPWLARFYCYENGVKTRPRYTWEFFDKSVYKRLLVTFGGFFTMLLTSILIFIVLETIEVDAYISKEELNKHGVYPTEYGRELGFEKGDKILSINGKDYERFMDLFDPELTKYVNSYYTILRDKDTIYIDVPQGTLHDLQIAEADYFLQLNAPIKISKVVENSFAEKAGLMKGDIILGSKEEEIHGFDEMDILISSHTNDTVKLIISRSGEQIPIDVRVSKEGKIGIFPELDIQYSFRENTFLEAMGSGLQDFYQAISVNILTFKQLVSREPIQKKGIRGPIGIAKIFTSDIKAFFGIAAIYLALLSFYEILPLPKSAALRSIPVLLEGGFNKKITYKAFRNTQKWLWSVFVLLYLWIVINDMIALFG